MGIPHGYTRLSGRTKIANLCSLFQGWIMVFKPVKVNKTLTYRLVAHRGLEPLFPA